MRTAIRKLHRDEEWNGDPLYHPAYVAMRIMLRRDVLARTFGYHYARLVELGAEQPVMRVGRWFPCRIEPVMLP
jgi:hypothetical protein